MDTKTLLRSVEEIAKYKSGKVSLKATEVVAPLVNVKELRTNLGFSQTDFAKTFHLSVGTVRNWEQGVREPDGPARLLLNLIARNPKLIEKEIRQLHIA